MDAVNHQALEIPQGWTGVGEQSRDLYVKSTLLKTVHLASIKTAPEEGEFSSVGAYHPGRKSGSQKEQV